MSTSNSEVLRWPMRTAALVLCCIVANDPYSVCLSSPGEVDPRVMELATENASTYGLILSANVIAQVKLANVDAGSTSSQLNNRELHWTKRGATERLVIHRTVPAVSGTKERMSTAVGVKATISIELDYDHSVCRYLDQRPLTGPVTSEGSVGETANTAYEAPLSRWHPEFEIHYLLCQKFYLNVWDETRTFSDMAREWPSEYRGTEAIGDATCDVVRVFHPGVPPAAQTQVDFYLDRSAGALVRKVIVHHSNGQLICEVRRFLTSNDGVYFPIECVSGFVPQDPTLAAKAAKTEVRVTRCDINKSIEESDVQIRLPPGVIVKLFNSPLTPFTLGEEVDLGLIGSDGKMTRYKVNSPEWMDIRTLGKGHKRKTESHTKRELIDEETPSPSASMPALWLALAGALSVSVVCWFAYRTLQRKRRRDDCQPTIIR